MIKIIIDHREKNEIINILKNLEKGAEIEVKNLSVGDFILSKDVVIERKTINDFLSSLIDKRLFEQARELKHNFKKPLFLIEGNLEEIYNIRDINENAIRAAMLSLILDFEIPFLFSTNILDSAKILITIARREQIQKNKEISLRGSKIAYTMPQMQQYFVEGLPLVGPNLAKLLLKKFKTPKKIVNAKLEKLKKVEKIGDKKAKLIRDILDLEYNENN